MAGLVPPLFLLLIVIPEVIAGTVEVGRKTSRELADVLISFSGAQTGCGETSTFDRRAVDVPSMSLLAG